MGKIVNIGDVRQTVEKIPEVSKELTSKIKKLSKEIENDQVKIIEKAVKLGGHLHKLKSSLKHGEFMGYCESVLHINYKKAQRYMDISQYQDVISVTPVETLSEALQITSGLKKKEKEERTNQEKEWFNKYHSNLNDHREKTDTGEESDRPEKPWKGHEDERNIENRYKKFTESLTTGQQEPESTDNEDAIDEPSTEVLIDSAFQRAMLILDRIEDAKEKDFAITQVIYLLQNEVMLKENDDVG